MKKADRSEAVLVLGTIDLFRDNRNFSDFPVIEKVTTIPDDVLKIEDWISFSVIHDFGKIDI